MIQDKRKNKRKAGIAAFQILTLIMSIVAISYFIGEIGFASATNIENVPPTNPNPKTTPTPGEIVSTAKTAYDIISALIKPPSSMPVSTGGLTSLEAGAPLGPGGTSVAGELSGGPSAASETEFAHMGDISRLTDTSGWWKSFGTNLANTWWQMGINLGVALGLYYGISLGFAALWPDVNPDVWNQAGLYASLGYGIGATAVWLLNAAGVTAFGFWGTVAGGGIGLVVGAVLFLFFVHDEYTAAVLYTCYPWQPKSGGAECGKCNGGEFPCTKYKCQSLGMNCELLNPGTSSELCTFVDRNDPAPPAISSWNEPLDTTNYKYVPDSARLPPDRGVTINYIGAKADASGCIPPFTKFNYGITLDKPGQCRVSINRTNSFATMTMPGLISEGYYLYNHTLTSVHAGGADAAAEGISLPNGGEYEIFVRCESKGGVSNAGTFVFKYCVQNEPDITAPTIKLTNLPSGMPIQYGATSMPTQIYTDKPADCKWSHNDESYDTMAGTMTCSQGIGDYAPEINTDILYKCSTTLTGLQSGVENKFYFRCKSYPEHDTDNNPDTLRYTNEESTPYVLIGTRQLNIDSLTVNGFSTGATIKDATQSVKVTLQAKTSAGYKDGEAKCYFKKSSEADRSYVMFLNTNSYQSSQDLWLARGNYAYSIKCCDLGGNCDTEATSFTVDTDFNAPVVVRAYNEGGSLKIVTNEKAECVYGTTDCSYIFEDGIAMTTSDNLEHFTTWSTANNLYIKCKDEFNNQPASGCSITVRPSSF